MMEQTFLFLEWKVQLKLNLRLVIFKLKKTFYRRAADIAQMYDLFAYRNCQRIQELPKDSPERANFILEIHRNEERLLEFLAMLKIGIARPSEQIEKALADWVAFTFAKRIREEAPIIPERVRAGAIVMRSPSSRRVQKYEEKHCESQNIISLSK